MAFQRFFSVATTDPNQRRRGTIILSVSALLCVLLVLAVPLTLLRTDSLPSLLAIGLGVLLVGSAITFARAGRVQIAGWLLVTISATVVVLPSILRREVTTTLFYLVIPILIASVVLRPWQVWVALVCTYLAIALNIGLNGTWALDMVRILQNLALVLMVTAGIGYLSARLTQQAIDQSEADQQAARAFAAALERANSQLETQVVERTGLLQHALAEVEQRAATQEHMLAEIGEQRVTIREMSTPVLPLSRHTLIMPLVGAMDTVRLQNLQEQALSAIEQRRARHLLLDVTGVPLVDSQVAQGLISVVNAARLLGAQVTLVGVRPEVAQAIVSLGLDLSAVQTEQNLETAINELRMEQHR